MGAEHRENGLAARLLLTYPPRRPKQWRDDEVPLSAENSLCDLLSELFELQPMLDSNEDPKPGHVMLSDKARELFVAFYNQTGVEQSGLSGDLAAAWSKLEEYAARLALVIHCVRQASGKSVDV